MRGRPSLARVGLVVAIEGMATLAAEISVARLMAPFFGSSTLVWANVIGLTLSCLAAGYWLGGKLADHRPDRQLLGALVLAAAAELAAMPFFAEALLAWVSRVVDGVSFGPALGSFIAALVLFILPVTLLGCVSPFAIRLVLTDVREAGTVTGRLYALSTVGSLVGAFVSALVTLPLLGTRRTLLGCALLLAVCALILFAARGKARRADAVASP